MGTTQHQPGEKQPTWNSIAAGEAKAYAPWPGYWVHTYGDYAAQLDAADGGDREGGRQTSHERAVDER